MSIYLAICPLKKTAPIFIFRTEFLIFCFGGKIQRNNVILDFAVIILILIRNFTVLLTAEEL